MSYLIVLDIYLPYCFSFPTNGSPSPITTKLIAWFVINAFQSGCHWFGKVQTWMQSCGAFFIMCKRRHSRANNSNGDVSSSTLQKSSKNTKCISPPAIYVCCNGLGQKYLADATRKNHLNFYLGSNAGCQVIGQVKK